MQPKWKRCNRNTGTSGEWICFGVTSIQGCTRLSDFGPARFVLNTILIVLWCFVVDVTVFYCLCIDILLLKDNETHVWLCESVCGRDSDHTVGSISSKCCTQVVGCKISVKFDNAIGYVNIMIIYCFHWGFVCDISLLEILFT